MNALSKQARLCAVAVISLLGITSSSPAQAWKEVIKKEGVTIWQKKIEGSPFVAFRGQVVVDASIKKVMAVLNDQDHKTEWMKQCVANYVLEFKKLGTLVIYNRTGSPFPLVADRDIVVETNLSFDRETGIIDIHAVNTTHPNGKVLDGVIRMKQMKLHWALKYLDKTKTLVTYEVQTDPGGWIPAWVVNLVTKAIPFHTLQGLQSQVKKPYEKSLAYVEASFDWSTVGL
jgi:hypothetical protein